MSTQNRNFTPPPVVLPQPIKPPTTRSVSPPRRFVQEGPKDFVTRQARQFKTAVDGGLQLLFNIRMIITIFLIIWLIAISYLLLRPAHEDDEKEDRTRLRYFNFHRLWFGEESIVYILFKIWYWTVILFMFHPLIREVVAFMRTYVFV